MKDCGGGVFDLSEEVEVDVMVDSLGEDGSVVSAWRVVDEDMEEKSLLEGEEEREVVLEVGECRPGGWR